MESSSMEFWSRRLSIRTVIACCSLAKESKRVFHLACAESSLADQVRCTEGFSQPSASRHKRLIAYNNLFSAIEDAFADDAYKIHAACLEFQFDFSSRKCP